MVMHERNFCKIIVENYCSLLLISSKISKIIKDEQIIGKNYETSKGRKHIIIQPSPILHKTYHAKISLGKDLWLSQYWEV